MKFPKNENKQDKSRKNKRSPEQKSLDFNSHHVFC